jgi:uncharacterized damage-inducible protein DinB
MYIRNLSNRLLSYNLWATERITSWLMTIDQNQLYVDLGSSFGSIDRTLQHILSAQNYWYSIIIEEKVNEFDQPFKENSVAEVMSDLVKGAQKIVDDISELNEQQLIEQIKASDSTQSRYEYIFHLVNHSSYHRGQIVSICRSLGIKDDIPVTDYDAYLWWVENN